MKTMNLIEQQVEWNYRRNERVAILSNGGPIEPWMERMGEDDADAWARDYAAEQANRGQKVLRL